LHRFAARERQRSDLRHGIVNNLKNQQQMTVLQVFEVYYADERILRRLAGVRQALQFANFAE
jgi:hypothetical protein